MAIKWYGDRYKAQMNTAVIKALYESINLVDRDIKLGTPVRSGTLRNNNVNEVDEKKLIARERNNTEYAPNVEFGTRFQKAQSFFRAGFIKNIRNIINIFRKRSKNAIGS